jgi:nucleosome-remodeling factor subunit BPTF
LLNANQIVVNNPTLAQQLASGKATLATLNGQQVLIRAAATSGGQSNVIIKSALPQTTQTVKIQPTVTKATGTSVQIAKTPQGLVQVSLIGL